MSGTTNLAPHPLGEVNGLNMTTCNRFCRVTRTSPHNVAQHRPTGSERTPPYAPRSSRFGSESPSVEEDVGVWRYAELTDSPRTKQIHDMHVHHV